jgi:hypothetical protein
MVMVCSVSVNRAREVPLGGERELLDAEMHAILKLMGHM